MSRILLLGRDENASRSLRILAEASLVARVYDFLGVLDCVFLFRSLSHFLHVLAEGQEGMEGGTLATLALG